MNGGQKVISRSRNKAALVMVISTLPTTAYLYLPLPTYRCILSSNANGSSNIYIPLPTYHCLPTAAYLVAMAMVVVISTYLCLPTTAYLPLHT